MFIVAWIIIRFRVLPFDISALAESWILLLVFAFIELGIGVCIFHVHILTDSAPRLFLDPEEQLGEGWSWRRKCRCAGGIDGTLCKRFEDNSSALACRDFV
jgi:hypothetical protein